MKNLHLLFLFLVTASASAITPGSYLVSSSRSNAGMAIPFPGIILVVESDTKASAIITSIPEEECVVTRCSIVTENSSDSLMVSIDWEEKDGSQKAKKYFLMLSFVGRTGSGAVLEQGSTICWPMESIITNLKLPKADD